MIVIDSVVELKNARAEWERPVGLVPTMGYLHEGHLSLVRRARQENRTVVVSIFVNPTQFGPSEDLSRYPRDMRRDLQFLDHEVVDVVFAPTDEAMYPPGYSTWVELQGITGLLEGASRPGHFRGVATVCNKLFNIISPDRAYFGQKDAQQVAVLNRMVRDLDMNLDLIVLPTVREADGLAMSSRNAYLSAAERAAAPVLHRALAQAREMRMSEVVDVEVLRSHMRHVVGAEPLARLEYATVVDPESFEEIDCVRGRSLGVIAVRIGATRLIDNMSLDE